MKPGISEPIDKKCKNNQKTKVEILYNFHYVKKKPVVPTSSEKILDPDPSPKPTYGDTTQPSNVPTNTQPTPPKWVS